MTLYGLNPSFCNWTSRLPLFSDAIRRGRAFELFDNINGQPTSQAPVIGPDGWPVSAPVGLSNGVRVFGGMDGLMGEVNIQGGDDLKVRSTRDAATVLWSGGGPRTAPIVRDHATKQELAAEHAGLSSLSLEALKWLRPSVLRTLDWSRANERTDWSRRRVLPADPLQGTERGMALETQVRITKLLGAQLWWNAPPRYELDSLIYEDHLSEMLEVFRRANIVPILEYGNELWNAGFPVNGWLVAQAKANAVLRQEPSTWQGVAAQEIARMAEVADRVLGPGGYRLFVGGQLTVPSHLDKILNALRRLLSVPPDLAGPALYVTPMKDDKEGWESIGAVPTQVELEASCAMRLVDDIASPQGLLAQHKALCAKYSVPHLACYEAGQSLIAGSHPWRAAALAAQGTKWMGDLYRSIRATAEAAGVEILNWYSAATSQAPADPRVDVFGLLGHWDVAKAPPKARAARGD